MDKGGLGVEHKGGLGVEHGHFPGTVEVDFWVFI
jgi:hypothetical protein